MLVCTHCALNVVGMFPGVRKASALQRPLDSGSDDSDFASTSESEDEQMGSDVDADVRSQNGEANMEDATTSGEGA